MREHNPLLPVGGCKRKHLKANLILCLYHCTLFTRSSFNLYSETRVIVDNLILRSGFVVRLYKRITGRITSIFFSPVSSGIFFIDDSGDRICNVLCRLKFSTYFDIPSL